MDVPISTVTSTHSCYVCRRVQDLYQELIVEGKIDYWGGDGIRIPIAQCRKLMCPRTLSGCFV